MKNSYRSCCELLNVLETNKFVIYGTGFVARRFYEALCAQGLDKNIRCFIVSKKEDISYIYGIEVKPVAKYSNDSNNIICIAVHEALIDEIVKILRRKRLGNYVWIYPYLNEMFLGKPIKENIKVSVDRIIRQNCDYRMAVRLLALENFLKKNEYGFDIYRKAQSLYCSEATTEKRLQSFCRLIQNWERYGYRADSKILIDDKGQIVDGAHRIVLAKYFKLTKVNCDIYKHSSHLFEWMGDKSMLTEKIIEGCTFTDEEIETVKDAYQRMRGEG